MRPARSVSFTLLQFDPTERRPHIDLSVDEGQLVDLDWEVLLGALLRTVLQVGWRMRVEGSAANVPVAGVLLFGDSLISCQWDRGEFEGSPERLLWLQSQLERSKAVFADMLAESPDAAEGGNDG